MTEQARKPTTEQPPSFSSVVCASVPVGALAKGERRFEGEAYLTDGYRFRLAIETSGSPFRRLREVARVWQPSRLKGVVLPREHGVPFLTTNQIFDIDPKVRKWLAPAHVPELDKRYLEPGWILITCSGNGMNNNVGKVFASYAPHVGKVVSHDLLRVQVHSQSEFGALYAFLRSKFGRSMLRTSQYGSAIKHLEPEHVEAIPIPVIPGELGDALAESIAAVFSLRDESYGLLREAAAQFAAELDSAPDARAEESSFFVASQDVARRARRLDAYHYNPTAQAVLQALRSAGRPIWPLSRVTKRVFLPNRFVRVFAGRGTPFLDSEDVFKINPDINKYIPPAAKKDAANYKVQRGWLLLARSGQIYGINGTPILATARHENKIISEHLIRIVPNGEVRGGYLQIALGHEVFGRPLVLRWAFGSGVPEISPDDLATFPVIRLGRSEDSIADKVERAGRLREEADRLEDEAVALIEAAVEHKIRSIDEEAHDVRIARIRLKEIEAHPGRLLRGERLEEKLAAWLS